MKKICVFDLDGTLVDSIADIAAAVNASLRRMGKPAHPLEAYYRMVGDGMDLLCKRALGGESANEAEKLIALYQEEYLKNCCVHTQPYPGIPALLNKLRAQGIKLAVLSNKPQVQTDEIAARLFPAGTFFQVIGQSRRFPKKPAPDSLFHLLQSACYTREDAWYIGDSDVDMLLGLNAQVDNIGAAWGFRGSAELRAAGAAHIARNAAELEKIILSSSPPNV